MRWPRSILTRTGGRPALAALLVLATAVFLATVPLHRGFFDVGVYYGTVNDWIHHDGRIYDYLRPGTHYGFTYPPFAAVVMLPMALVSWHVAIAISTVLSVLASVLLLRWLAGPAVRRLAGRRVAPGRDGEPVRRERRPWFVFVVAGCLFALFEPVRDTFSFGQVNLLLVALVFADARLLATGRGRYAGIGIGLATAIKLTPALFIGYLLVTGRRRQAAVATGTAGAATLLAALVDPGASRAFWTGALWDTDRVGSLSYVSNQSLQGVLARLQPEHPSRLVWLVCVLAVLAVWAYRSRAAVRDGDDRTGFALTGLAACLVSPVTWVHHLVWLVPALLVLTDSALSRNPGERRRPLAMCAALYVVLCSSVVWLWRWDSTGLDAFLGANIYVWITLGLLFVVASPERSARSAAAPGTVRLRGAPTAVVTDGVAATRSAGVWRRRAVDPSGDPGSSG
ncbi:glycosyltransferase 87 family protein [Streptomyces sp. 35G-GA-8]|uniref:glycosyltransferase 87 family protein n=1 Tax=Streptomyces sp. 35G-GA-8 TaxID=2939434 RepID=UPI00201EA67A|nr:glycosyltransferase 87 family protein [Streptomyces sp. 35G-GA-8]MCL7378494.1 glycosyltransferase 87 family protein [Streptomyces sp. 35G-GA-8]